MRNLSKIKTIVVISIVLLIFISGFAITYSYLDSKLTENSVGVIRNNETVFQGLNFTFPDGIQIIPHDDPSLNIEEDLIELSDLEIREAIERDFAAIETEAVFEIADALDELLIFSDDENIFERVEISDRIFNVLLLGDDARIDQDRGRSDTIILISFNRDTRVIHLTSFMRDILMPTNPSGNFWNRINILHAIGGPGRTINQINNIFSMDIQRYAVIGFSGVFPLIDALEGLELNLRSSEALVLNRIFPDYDPVQAGYNLLNGRQVLAYSRIRAIDNDLARTQRQRYVIKTIFEKLVETKNIADIFTLAAFAMDHVETNIPLNEILSIGLELFTGPKPYIEELRIPIDGSYNHAQFYGAFILTINFEENITALHEALYGSALGIKIPVFIYPEMDNAENIEMRLAATQTSPADTTETAEGEAAPLDAPAAQAAEN